MNQTMKRLCAATAVATMVVIGLSLGGATRDDGVGARIDERAYQVPIPPATQIISYDQTVARFDTRTGAIYMYRGELDDPCVRGYWELRVPGVNEKTSGMLELQRANFNDPAATFLVDTVTGKTWLLHRRGNHNGTWDIVEIFK